MIRTERQLKAAEEKLRQVQESAEAASDVDRDVLQDFAEELELEIDEYKSIRKGETYEFKVNDVSYLAEVLIKARLARGLTQEQLAKNLGVSEQQVQRDEAGGYEKATLSRLADVAGVLGYRLVGFLQPSEPKASLTVDQLLSK